MKFSRLAEGAAACVMTAQVVLAASVLRFNALKDLCLNTTTVPIISGTRVRVNVCPEGTPAIWTFDLDPSSIHPVTNLSLCLVRSDFIGGDLSVSECGTGTGSDFRQGYSYNSTTKLIFAPTPISMPPLFQFTCIHIGSDSVPCNATDEGQLWVVTDT